jgi:NADPH:quinone reductase-like Zn-dependent oxidoreductase
MKAILCSKYGPPEVLHLSEVEPPVPKDNEVLIRVRAASINKADWIIMRGKPFIVRFSSGLLRQKAKIPGSDVAGRIEAVGKNIRRFQPGDDVFGNLSKSGRGAYAEYVCAPESELVLKPGNVSFEQAASLPIAAITALQGLRDKGKIQTGQKVLIYGASGGVGTFAVQIAKSFGAEVTAVCSTKNLETARSLGADHVIDYSKEDFTLNGKRYDLIIAANGYRSISAYKKALTPKGIYVMTGGTGGQIFQALLLGPLLSMTGGRKMGGVSAKMNLDDLALLGGLLEAGKVVPVIDRVYKLEEVPEAFQYVGEGHARGKVVISMGIDD